MSFSKGHKGYWLGIKGEKHPCWKDGKPKCMDCGKVISNYDAKRCKKCRVIYKTKNAHGRIIGRYCVVCKKELSCKKNVTGKCFNCFLKTNIPWNKGKKGSQVAWNKGKGIFKTKKDYRIHFNKRRKLLRKSKINTYEIISDRVRTLIRNSIKNFVKHNPRTQKRSKTTILLGCSLKYFKGYLENKFSDNMDWSNYGNGYGKWNIDHIIPVSKFNLFSLQEQKNAFNYRNCRPMWSIDNIKKGNRMGGY
jgi:hypothetical protein